jgi:hypothetical protein
MAVICNINPSHLFIEELAQHYVSLLAPKLVETKAQVNEVTLDNTLLVKKLSLELEATQRP